MIFGFIKNHEKKYPIEKMCKVLEVSQSGYYNWKSTIISKRRLKMMQLKEQIAAIYFSSKQRYGSPRITKE
jgi:ACT domain-containing protein